jgi:hypothetical protein
LFLRVFDCGRQRVGGGGFMIVRPDGPKREKLALSSKTPSLLLLRLCRFPSARIFVLA